MIFSLWTTRKSNFGGISIINVMQCNCRSTTLYHHPVYHVNIKKRLKLPFPESNEFVVTDVMYPECAVVTLCILFPHLPLTDHPLLH